MSEVERPWICYMLRCKGGLLYTGIATNVSERLKEHNWGVGAIFTSKRRPVELIWWEEHPDQKSARQRERELKGWRREKKLGLIATRQLGSDPSRAKDAGSG